MLRELLKAEPEEHINMYFPSLVNLSAAHFDAINNFSIGWLIPGVVFSVIALASFTTAEQVARRRHDLG